MFLAVQKIVEIIFGSREYALRLVPLMAACTAICLFPFLARQVLDRRAVPVGVALFVLSDPLIRYSSTNKQYSTDVAMAVFIYWLLMRFRHRLDEPSVVFSLATLGAFAPFLSFPSLLIVLGASVTLAGRVLVTRRLRAGLPGFAIGGACLLSLAAVYFIAVRQLSHLQASFAGNTSTYLGGSSGSVDVMATAGKVRYVAGISHLVVFGFDTGKAAAIAVTCLCLIGFAALFRRDREMAVILVSPVPFLLLAAFAQKYPLLGRTLLFLLPVIVLLLAQGMVVAMQAARSLLWRALILLTIVAIGISIANRPLQHLFAPRTEEEMKPVMTYLARHQRPADTLYIYYPSPYGFRYYLQCSCAPATIESAYSRGLWPAQFAPGGRTQYAPALQSTPPKFLAAKFRDRDPHSYVPDLQRLRGRRRVWILYSDIPTAKRKTLIEELNRFGSRKASFRGGPDESSAVVHLYDFAH